ISRRFTYWHQRGIDLNKPGLFEIELVRRSPSQFEIIWVVHHAILDGWSITVLNQQLQQLLEGSSKTVVKSPRATFSQLVSREIAIVSDVSESDFWANSLAGAEVSLLPRLPRENKSDEALPIEYFELSADLVKRSRILAARCQV